MRQTHVNLAGRLRIAGRIGHYEAKLMVKISKFEAELKSYRVEHCKSPVVTFQVSDEKKIGKLWLEKDKIRKIKNRKKLS